jgi:ribosomal protein S18 acetylase RimI-like enzyme
MTVKILRFEEKFAKDLAGLDKTWKREGISPGFETMTEKEFKKDCKKAICFVAESNSKIIGYALGKTGTYKKKKKLFFLKRGEKFVNFDSLYVLGKYRKSGVGKKLILALIKESKNRGFDSVHLVADSKKHADLTNLYKSCGFEVVFTRMKLDLK